MTTNFSLDFIYIITYFGSVLPTPLDLIHCSIIVMISSVLIYYSNRWIKNLINGVERTVLATSSRVVINDALGRPIPIFNLGRKSGNPDNNQGTQGNNVSKSILFSSFIKSIKSKQNDIKNSQSFILPLILSILDVNVPEGSENLTNYAFGVMTMSLIALLCFMNVLGYFLSLHILDKYNILNRFPRLNKIKTYYEKTTIIFIIFESLFCISILLFLILSAYLYLKSVIIT